VAINHGAAFGPSASFDRAAALWQDNSIRQPRRRRWMIAMPATIWQPS
jgi:hypothetical protein